MSQEQVTALRPLSLDFAWEDDDGEDHSLLDRLAASPLEATEPSCQEPTSTEHAQLEVLFTWLSPRAQQALRLRYGLAEDGRALPPEDIAHEQTGGHRASWSHTSSTSPTSKRRAPKVERPRKVAARKEASPKPRKLRPPKPACPIIPRQPKMRQPRKQVFLPWYPKAVLQAYADLQQEGRMITVQTLAQRAGVQWTTAQKFLRREQGTVLFPLGSCQHRLEAAYPRFRGVENIPRN